MALAVAVTFGALLPDAEENVVGVPAFASSSIAIWTSDAEQNSAVKLLVAVEAK